MYCIIMCKYGGKGGGFGIGTFAGLGMDSNLGTNCMKNWPRKITSPVIERDMHLGSRRII